MLWLTIGAVVVLAVALLVVWALRRSAEQALPTTVAAPRVPDAGLDAEAAQLVAQGRKLEAIKRVRAATGVGLKEAKDYVDGLGAAR